MVSGAQIDMRTSFFRVKFLTRGLCARVSCL